MNDAQGRNPKFHTHKAGWRAARLLALVAVAALSACSNASAPPPLRVGVSAVPITPCGESADWDGPITVSGVWGEAFEDLNANLRWDPGEPFTDEPANDELDATSEGEWDGIYMAGFGSDRIAIGCHDDLWARTLVVDDGETRVSMTVVDTIGMLTWGSYSGFQKERAQLAAELELDSTIYSSTHNHEGPDTIGLWGPELTSDGKFPLYMRYIDRQVARSLREAVGSLAPVAEVRAFSATTATNPELKGLQVRTGCRPPWIFDDELRGLAFLGADGDALATFINWGTHPESLEDENLYISSDFPHWIREQVEQTLGGTAVYASADLGAVEIVGDTCVTGADARNPDGSNEFDVRDNLGFARTEAIGRLVGGVVAEGLRAAEPLDVVSLATRRVEYRSAASNALFELGRLVGVLDLDSEIYDPTLCPGATGLCGLLEQSVVEFLGRDGTPEIQMITLPGEVFPELFLGVAANRRTDCPAADTGRPAEPSIRDRMTAPYRFVIGLSPDQIGYVVPGYDFYAGIGLDEETSDVCRGQGYDPAVARRTVPAHYHETLSVGVEVGALVTCKAAELLAGPESIANEQACQGLP